MKKTSPSLIERPVLIPTEARSYDWNKFFQKDSYSLKQLKKLTKCTFQLKSFGGGLYVHIKAETMTQINAGVNEIENIIWNEERTQQQVNQTIPKDFFKEQAVIPSDIFDLNPATGFKDEEQRGAPEIVWLPTEKLGLILGNRASTNFVFCFFLTGIENKVFFLIFV